MITGKITRISGPIVYAEGLEKCGLYDVVDVGNAKLIGEIIRQDAGKATIEVYEDDGGMQVGEPVVSNGRPLSLKLGPGLVGTIYDGIQRPLKQMFESGGAFPHSTSVRLLPKIPTVLPNFRIRLRKEMGI